MSAPRPYETDPFHPQSSVHVINYDQFVYLYKSVPSTSSIWYLYYVLVKCTIVIYACAFLELLISRFCPILVHIVRLDKNTLHLRNT